MKSVRVIYKKYGRAVYISHLDMNRFMTRAVRLAELPIWYTQGFNPHPYITFAQPLSLGFESDTEILDMKMEEDISNDEIKKRLSSFMPSGIEIVAVTDNMRSPVEIAFAKYIIKIKLIGKSVDSVKSLFDRQTIIVKKKSKKGEKDFDLKPILNNVKIADNGDYITVEVTLPSSVSLSVNPTLIITALEKYQDAETDDYIIRKTELLDEKGESFIQEVAND